MAGPCGLNAKDVTDWWLNERMINQSCAVWWGREANRIPACNEVERHQPSPSLKAPLPHYIFIRHLGTRMHWAMTRFVLSSRNEAKVILFYQRNWAVQKTWRGQIRDQLPRWRAMQQTLKLGQLLLFSGGCRKRLLLFTDHMKRSYELYIEAKRPSCICPSTKAGNNVPTLQADHRTT
jgi:hypothetical protein